MFLQPTNVRAGHTYGDLDPFKFRWLIPLSALQVRLGNTAGNFCALNIWNEVFWDSVLQLLRFVFLEPLETGGEKVISTVVSALWAQS